MGPDAGTARSRITASSNKTRLYRWPSPQGAASLGVEVQNGLGEGPAVVSLRLKDSPFKTGDIIYSLDDRRIADIPELVRILASYRPGDDVRVVVRRGDNERELRVELTPR